MPDRIDRILRKRPMWQWLIISVVFSEVLTFFISFFVSRILWGKMPYEVLIIGIIDSLFVSFVIVSVLLFSIHTVRKLYERLETRNKELSAAILEIKTLQGILPICSYCKQIRNDKGYYEQIETYIHKHSDVNFSHTICPDCAKKHFPDLDLTDENPVIKNGLLSR